MSPHEAGDRRPHDKYEHALGLLARRLSTDINQAVHLDLMCGSGHMAELLSVQHGVHYVGVDVDGDRIEALTARGFEAHVADLDSSTVAASLDRILDGRPLASITLVDGLEYLGGGPRLLDAIGAMLARERAVGVVSVPNATHLDIGIKALLGEWDYVDPDVLEQSPVRLYSRPSLRAVLRTAGLTSIEEADVVVAHSDQHFPADHVALSRASSVGQWLRHLRSAAEPSGMVSHFVWTVVPVPPAAMAADSSVGTPFLSVIMRTQGRREQELREALLCLAGQTDLDFEVLVVAHRTTRDQQTAVERVLEDQPPALRARTRLMLLDHGSRSAPLNLGLREARGRYIGVFDDDDLVLGHWVEEFHKAADRDPGRVLRSSTLRQDAAVVDVRGFPGVRAVGAPTKVWSTEFSLIEHLVGNQSPSMGWIYPRSLHVHMGLAYDESMTTTEDWDVLLRAAELAGVTDIDAVTAIYHFWTERESSATLHSRDEWNANQREIERRLDSRPFLVPPGETRALRRTLVRMQDVERGMCVQDLATQQQAVNMDVERRQHEQERRRLTRRLARKNAELLTVRGQNAEMRRQLAGRDEGSNPPSASESREGQHLARGWMRRVRKIIQRQR